MWCGFRISFFPLDRSPLFQIDHSYYIFLLIIQFMALASLYCKSLVCRKLKRIFQIAEGMTHNAASKSLFNISNKVQNVHRDWTRKSCDIFFSYFPYKAFVVMRDGWVTGGVGYRFALTIVGNKQIKGRLSRAEMRLRLLRALDLLTGSLRWNLALLSVWLKL